MGKWGAKQIVGAKTFMCSNLSEWGSEASLAVWVGVQVGSRSKATEGSRQQSPEALVEKFNLMIGKFLLEVKTQRF